jgi:hypothetical protein
MNIHVCRRNWHVGVGVDSPMEWDRFELFKNQLAESGFSQQAIEIEGEQRYAMEKLWEK